MTTFRLIHATDFHLCLEPNRANRVMLWLSGKSDTLQNFKETNISKFPKVRPIVEGPVDFAHLQEATGLQRYFEDFYFGSYRPEVAEQFARYLTANESKIDCLIISGDLATTGLSEDLEAANRYFEFNPNWKISSSGTSYRPPLKLDAACLVLPGNHDRYADGAGIVGGKLFDKTFERVWPHRKSATGLVNYSVIEDKGQALAVIGADFNLRTKDDVKAIDGLSKLKKVLGRGHVHDGILADLVSTTKRLKEAWPGIFIIWTVHFAVWSIKNKHLRLQKWKKLRKAAIDNGIKFILSGHTHEEAEYGNSSCRNLVTGSVAAVEKGGPHTFSLFEVTLEKGSLMEIKHRFLDFQNDMFDELRDPIIYEM